MRHARKLPTVLIALCSLALLPGCAGREIPPPPVILKLPDCPMPPVPELDKIDAVLMFDEAPNAETLIRRDDAIRFYIDGLKDTIVCYRRIIKGET